MTTPTFKFRDKYDQIWYRNVKSGREFGCFTPFFVDIPEKVKISKWLARDTSKEVTPDNFATMQCYYEERAAEKRGTRGEEDQTIPIYCKGINGWGQPLDEKFAGQRHQFDKMAQTDVASMSRLAFKMGRACLNALVQYDGNPFAVFNPMNMPAEMYVNPDIRLLKASR